MLIFDLVLNAFKGAYSEAVNRQLSMNDQKPRQTENKQRSSKFVECLAGELRLKYENDNSGYRVLSRDYPAHKSEFGMNELLYDILVCDTGITGTVKNSDVKARYITKGIWAVESEMKKDVRQLLFDFNKLTLSSCESKLFIGPLTSYNNNILDVLQEVSKYINGPLYVIMVPHPEDWEKYDAFKLNNSEIDKLSFTDFKMEKQVWKLTDPN